jgi:hypothetical protein
LFPLPHLRPGGAQICSVHFDRADIPMNKLIVTGLESKFHVFDMRTYNPTAGYAYLTEKARRRSGIGAPYPAARLTLQPPHPGCRATSPPSGTGCLPRMTGMFS